MGPKLLQVWQGYAVYLLHVGSSVQSVSDMVDSTAYSNWSLNIHNLLV